MILGYGRIFKKDCDSLIHFLIVDEIYYHTTSRGKLLNTDYYQ